MQHARPHAPAERTRAQSQRSASTSEGASGASVADRRPASARLAQLAAVMNPPATGESADGPPASINPTGLSTALKAGVERLSGRSLDQVRVHRNSSKPAQLNAHAYAQGTEIHLAPGQEKHLPHEAWHVVQQAQGRVKPTLQMKHGVPINDDAGLEHEADVMGAKALQLGAVAGSPAVRQNRTAGPAESQPRKTNPGGGQKPVPFHRQASGAIQRAVIATWLMAGANTVITESDGTQTTRKESDGVTATVKPADWDTGSVTNADVRPISQAATRAFGVSFIAGHMLNKHLGGPGTDQKNIAAITSRQNSQHHSGLEKAAKAAVKAGKTIDYSTKITERATFELDHGKGKKSTAVNLASKLEGSYAASDKSEKGGLTIDLGPPNATKIGGSARAATGIDKFQEAAIEQANDMVDMLERDKKMVGDPDDFRDQAIALIAAGKTIEQIYVAAQKAGYVK